MSAAYSSDLLCASECKTTFYKFLLRFGFGIASAAVEGNEAMAKFKEPIQKYIIVPKRNKNVLKDCGSDGGSYLRRTVESFRFMECENFYQKYRQKFTSCLDVLTSRR